MLGLGTRPISMILKNGGGKLSNHRSSSKKKVRRFSRRRRPRAWRIPILPRHLCILMYNVYGTGVIVIYVFVVKLNWKVVAAGIDARRLRGIRPTVDENNVIQRLRKEFRGANFNQRSSLVWDRMHNE